MRRRILIVVSTGLNLVLAAAVAWLWIQRSRAHDESIPQAAETIEVHDPIIRTNVVVRRLNFTWDQIESDDYAHYIANLRYIGCPEPTIRDLVVADVNQLYAERRAREITSPQHEWWKSDPDPEAVRAATRDILALDQERRDLLEHLLGPEWESADYPYPAPFSAFPLDGPILADLSPEARAAVARLERDSLARQQAHVSSRRLEGKEPDPSELARLRAQTREELAKVLTPEQLEEFLLRYSVTASRLREQVRGLDPGPEEFRALFRALDPIDQQIEELAETDSSDAAQVRADLQLRREENLRQVLGVDRYQQYESNQDPLYREARALTTQAGVSTDKILPAAAILRLTREEEERIRSDTSLTVEEQSELLQVTLRVSQESLRRLLGEEAWQRYLENQRQVWDNAQP